MPLAVAVVLFVAFPFLAVAANYLYTVACSRDYRGFGSPNPPLVEETDPAWIQRQSFEAVSIVSGDGLRLRAYYLAAAATTNRVAILAHGYRGSAMRDMGPFSEHYHDRLGCNILMPDARGHGESEGDSIGFGWPERKDYLAWIDLMVQRHGPDCQIVLHGISMGAATVTIAAGEVLPDQVRCVVADCGYTSAIDELGLQLRRRYHLPPFPLLPMASLVCRLRAGYWLGDASPLRQVVKATRPMLFIHGGADDFVPTWMVHPLHDACPTPKALLIVPGAQHAMSFDVDPGAYYGAVDAFVGRWVGSGGSGDVATHASR